MARAGLWRPGAESAYRGGGLQLGGPGGMALPFGVTLGEDSGSEEVHVVELAPEAVGLGYRDRLGEAMPREPRPAAGLVPRCPAGKKEGPGVEQAARDGTPGPEDAPNEGSSCRRQAARCLEV